MTDTRSSAVPVVRVRPLAWDDSLVQFVSRGHAGRIIYSIERYADDDFHVFGNMNGYDCFSKRAPTVGAAKDAAQDDHDQHILSQITVQPCASATRNDALDEAAREVGRENERRLSLASIRIPAMISEISGAILALKTKEGAPLPLLPMEEKP